MASLGGILVLDGCYSKKTVTATRDRASVGSIKSTVTSSITKILENSRSSDSGKSSSCSPILLDCSIDSGIAGVLPTFGNDIQLQKRIKQCQCILSALERDQEHFCIIRNRLSKISDRKKKQSNENEYVCNVCCAEIEPEDEKTFAKCYICQKYICRSDKCADWLSKTAQWECELCQTSKESMAQTSSWVADQISFHQEKLVHQPRARSEIFIPISECNDSFIHFESVSQIGANSTLITAEQKFRIREYVEDVVAKLLGGNLDTIAVNQLSKTENYLPAPNGFSNSCKEENEEGVQESARIKANCSDFMDISETRLRQMIQKIIAETINLPPLANTHAVSEIALNRHSKTPDNVPLSNGYRQRHRTEHFFEPAIYQDLLATAVLNKIADKQLNNNQLMSESTPNLTGGGDEIVGSDGRNDIGIRHAALDQNLNVENLSTTSGSSVEPRSDCSFTGMEQFLNTNEDKSSDVPRNVGRDSVMSDYLASHTVLLPDLTAMATESEEDDYMSVTSSAVGDGTWENNWLFKKKKPTLGGSVAATSVGMLVPDPKEDVRAQIGDKTTDEVSDLSELGSSDTDDSSDILRSKLDPINDRLINKHLIGGQNNKMVLDELIEHTSNMISNTQSLSQEPAYTDICNDHVVNGSIKNEAINDNVILRTGIVEEKGDIMEVILPPVGFEDTNCNLLTGSIAEREYKKWYNAVEMPNNPYAPEALKRRISGSQERFFDFPTISPTKELNPLDLLNKDKLDVAETEKRETDYKRYSRDYYINSSSQASSQISPTREVSTPVFKDNPEKSTKDETEHHLYKAIPAKVIENTSSSIDAATSIQLTELEGHTTTTSDDSDTIKRYDFNKQEATTILKDTSKTKETKDDVASVNEVKSKERPSVLSLNRTESCGNVIMPTRGSTPTAFKFLQPKRKLLDPSQVLSVDEDEPSLATSPAEKPVIEEEVAHALPSVKALARAFLMTSNTIQPEKCWLRKARTLSQGGKKHLLSPIKSLDPLILSEKVKVDEDITITSDLSSLETDSSAVFKEKEEEVDITKDLTTSTGPTTNALSSPTAADSTSPVPLRQGVLKNNIAFFENLKYK